MGTPYRMRLEPGPVRARGELALRVLECMVELGRFHLSVNEPNPEREACAVWARIGFATAGVEPERMSTKPPFYVPTSNGRQLVAWLKGAG